MVDTKSPLSSPFLLSSFILSFLSSSSYPLFTPSTLLSSSLSSSPCPLFSSLAFLSLFPPLILSLFLRSSPSYPSLLLLTQSLTTPVDSSLLT